MPIILYFWSFCLTPEPQVEPPAALYFFTCGTRKRHVAEVAEWRKVSVTSAISAICVIKNGVLIFREKGCWKQFLRTFWGGLRKRPQKVRRMEVIRLLGDNANLHNRVKKNRLCGFVVCAERKKICIRFSGFSVFSGLSQITENPENLENLNQIEK